MSKLISRKNRSLGIAAGVVFSSAVLLAPTSASADTWDYFNSTDPAHHSVDVSDTDPAHHRPYVVCSASTTDCVLVPVPGFDLNGRAVNGGPSIPGYPANLPAGADPAHHSADPSDTDPAHHRPYLVCDSSSDCVLTPVPGFDLNGYPVVTTEPVTTVTTPAQPRAAASSVTASTVEDSYGWGHSSPYFS